jgi:hypothetical protein
MNTSIEASLVAQAMTALAAADELDLKALLKEAQLDAGDDGSGWEGLADGVGDDFPDLSTAEIDPDQVYSYLVEMLGEEAAQKVLVDAMSDAIEAGLNEMSGTEPSAQELHALLRRIQAGRSAEDDAENWSAGEWGVQQ